MSETITKQVDKVARINRKGIFGLCQSCYSSGVELKLTEVKSNDVGRTFFPVCKKCQEKTSVKPNTVQV